MCRIECAKVHNAFGNHQIYDGQGELVDSGDNTHPANLNPYRYRGYYYDPQSNFYYLKTRYYDPTTGRFISADNIETAVTAQQCLPNGLNLYLYCFNDPVNAKDENGDMPDWLKNALGVVGAVVLAAIVVAGIVLSGGALLVPILIGAGIGMAGSLVSQGVGNTLNGNGFFQNINWGSVLIGGLAGAAFATGIGGIFGAAAIGAVANASTAAFENQSWKNIGIGAIVGGVSGAVGYKLGEVMRLGVFGSSDIGFSEFFQATRVDAGFVQSALVGLQSSWSTFLPQIATSLSRIIIKILGKKGFFGG